MIRGVAPHSRSTSLAEAGIAAECAEQGDMAARALQKANYFSGYVAEHARAGDFSAVVAADDGLSVDRHPATPEARKIMAALLAGEWPMGTRVEVHRAIAVRHGKSRARVELTVLPFVYLGSRQPVHYRPYSYPLSHVLGPLGGDRRYAELSPTERDAFNLEHSERALRVLLDP